MDLKNDDDDDEVSSASAMIEQVSKASLSFASDNESSENAIALAAKAPAQSAQFKGLRLLLAGKLALVLAESERIHNVSAESERGNRPNETDVC